MVLDTLPLLALNLYFVSGSSFTGKMGKGRIVLIGSVKTRRGANRVQNIILSKGADRPIVNTTIGMGKAAINAAAGLSNRFVLGTSGKSILVVSCLKCRDGRVDVDRLGACAIRLDRTARSLSRIIIATFNMKRGGRDLINTIARIEPTRLGMPSSDLSASFTKHLSNIVTMRHDNRPNTSKTDF